MSLAQGKAGPKFWHLSLTRVCALLLMNDGLPNRRVRVTDGTNWKRSWIPVPPRLARWELQRTVSNIVSPFCLTDDGYSFTQKKNLMQNIERDIIFQYCYPRLDDKVTTQVNHLLKSPFCVHPKTGRVCVPIVASECESFDPFKVPTLPDLVREIEAYDAAHPTMPGEDGPRIPGRSILGGFLSFRGENPTDHHLVSNLTSAYNFPDFEKTSLKPHIEVFEQFVKGMDESIRNSLRAKRADEDRKSLAF